MTNNRPLRVFLCHSSNDKPAVRELYQKLRAEPWIQPWLDEEELYPGQDWNMEIEKAVEAADAIIVCLSKGSITKESYVQRELRIVLDYADYKPEGTIYILPVRLEECEPPRRLRAWQYADYFKGQRARAFGKLLISLEKRADSLGLRSKGTDSKKPIKIEKRPPKKKTESVLKKENKTIARIKFITPSNDWIAKNKFSLSNGMEFMRVPKGKFLMGSNRKFEFAFLDSEYPQHVVNIPYDYWMARFPITNELYNDYAEAGGITPPFENSDNKKKHPIMIPSWLDALKYSQWLNKVFQDELPLGLVLRLPTETEWEKAARGADGREYPWGNTFDKNKCNASQAISINMVGTTSVGLYSPTGDSPYGCTDMAGNIWEWTHSLYKSYPYKIGDGRERERSSGNRVLRGGAFCENELYVRCAFRYSNNTLDLCGIRIVASPVSFKNS